MKRSKDKLKSLGIKKEQPEHLRKAVKSGAGKNTRFKPGEVHNPSGSKLQIVAPRVQAKVVETLNDIVNDLASTAMSEQLAHATGINAEGATLLRGMVVGLFRAAMAGDVNAFKTVAAFLQSQAGGVNGKIPHIMQIEFVEECTCECTLPNHANTKKALEQARALLTVKNGGSNEANTGAAPSADAQSSEA